MEKWRSPHDGAAPDKRKKNALYIAIFLSLLAFGVQLLGAVYTGSIALLGDTAHLFTDLFSLIVSLVAVNLAARPTTELRSFGLYRMEVLASFINGLLLLMVSLALIWESLARLRNPQAILAGPLLLIAFLGLVLNLLSALALWMAMRGDTEALHHHHDHGHDHHHHDHGHHHEDRNLQGALLHVVSDAMGSLAVMVGAVLIHFTGFVQLDALLGIILSFLIAYWSIKLLMDTTHVLLESTPKHIQPDLLIKDLHSVDVSVSHVMDVHVWEITSRMYAATGEIFVKDITLEEAEALRRKAEALLKDRYGIAHTVLAIRRS
jgi:cobalt-zinc-cadmium efflux system protein